MQPPSLRTFNFPDIEILISYLARGLATALVYRKAFHCADAVAPLT